MTQLSTRSVILLAIASAVVTANAYYIHPIVGRVAADFAVGDGLVGAVPALNQIALAIGVLVLLPLGDRMNNRRLVFVCLAAQVVSLIVMALVQDFWVFAGASAALGFFTITPYLLPAYASKRLTPDRLGAVTAALTTGVIAGVVLSRTLSGVMAELMGWRSVYWIAAVLMAGAMLIVPLLMEADEDEGDGPVLSYVSLFNSLGPMITAHRPVIMSGVVQGLSFAIFLAMWMGIGLHLTSDAVGLGTDTVGYLAAFTALNVFTTPRLGRWADTVGAERARVVMGILQFVGVATIWLAGFAWWMVILPIALTSVAGPMLDVTGRMIGLREAPDIRTRLMTLYIVLMFIGGGMGSWAGTYAYDLAGWPGTSILCMALSSIVLALTLMEARRAAVPAS
ncbi:MAG: MFS transporter [Pseudomonadota bacterium]